jgi:hypothetical protein
MIHELKCWRQFFHEITAGVKTFEIRRNDRGFQLDDTLHLREYDRFDKSYTGEECSVKVTYILYGDFEGLQPGYVAMGIRLMDEEEVEEDLVKAGVSIYA